MLYIELSTLQMNVFIECGCDVLGTNRTAGPCDRNTGQCPCLDNVVGRRCDMCRENHWKIAIGDGCEPCDCDEFGSLAPQCNLVSLQRAHNVTIGLIVHLCFFFF